jgi:hypothetical protein
VVPGNPPAVEPNRCDGFCFEARETFGGACRVVGTVRAGVEDDVCVGVEDVGCEGEPVPVPAGGAHASVTPTTPRWIGSDNADTGVPSGTVNTNERCPPPIVVTVTVHC